MLGKGEASDRGDGDDGVWIFLEVLIHVACL